MNVTFHLSYCYEENCFNLDHDAVFICGSAKCLGEWNLNNAIEMKLTKTNKVLDGQYISSQSSQSSQCSQLSALIEIPFTCVADESHPTNLLEFEATVYFNEGDLNVGNDNLNLEIESNISKLGYKYFIGQRTSELLKDRKCFLKEIEFNWRKLNIPLPHDNTTYDVYTPHLEINDKWPAYDTTTSQQARIDSGWLLDNENEFQFHFFESPSQLWLSNLTQKPVFIDIVPWTTNSGLNKLKDYLISHVNFNESQIVANKRSTYNAFNSKDIYTTYRIRTFEKPSNLLFQFIVHEYEEDGSLNQNYIATGYFKVNKSLVDNSIFEVDISLLNSNQMVGTLRTEILLITSLNEPTNYVLKKNYNYHFNRSCIPIGHRGMGKTFDAGTLPGISFVENTIDSFREAYNRGAQMVEFDVVLTKDKKPIVYHDFVFCIDQANLNNLTKQNSSKYLSIAVNQLTYDEVKQNKIYSHTILNKYAKDDESVEPKMNDSNSFTSSLMFPTLREMCNELDSKLGFNVEIKYPIDLEDGTQEVDNHIKWLNRNEYVDIILKELLDCTQVDEKRCIIITTFDPNLCSMIRLKQNKFPVLFLTNGITNKWKPYKDSRCKNTQISLNYAKAEFLHGIVAHAEELTKNLHLINILFNHTSKSANFYAYSWGDDLNEEDKRKLLSQSGINGIIYDRINEKNSSE